MMLTSFSVSRMREFLSCEKRYEYKYVMNLAPRTYARALEFGNMGHKFLELYYEHIRQGNTPETYDFDGVEKLIRTERGEEDFDAFSKQAFETDMYALKGMIPSYINYYKEDTKKFEVLLTELMMKDDIIYEGITFKGKPDLVVAERSTGYVWVVDHKFLAQVTQGLIRKLPLDYQVHAYLKMMEVYLKTLNRPELKLRGVIYNIVKKSGKRVKKDQSISDYQQELFADYTEKPQEYFFREYVIVTPYQTRNFKDFVLQMAKDMNRKHALGGFKQNVYACDNYGECPYMELCLQGVDEAKHLFKPNWEKK